MAKLTKKANTFATAHERVYMCIENEDDLVREGLTLYDYYEVKQILCRLSNLKGKAETMCVNVATWFTRAGFTVKPKGIGWEVKLG